MARQKIRKARGERLFPEASALPSVPAAAALSFLRETRGLTTWTDRDMVKSLRINAADARRVIAILELQGYVKSAGANEWMTTLSGEEVSGSKPPRFTRERVQQALDDLRRRIADLNRDSRSPYKISEAVAFGDFLSDRPRVQPAEVGIGLESRRPGDDANSAEEHKARRVFLRELKGKRGVLQVREFEKWMSNRTHLDLR